MTSPTSTPRTGTAGMPGRAGAAGTPEGTGARSADGAAAGGSGGRARPSGDRDRSAPPIDRALPSGDRAALPGSVPLDRTYDTARLVAEVRALRTTRWRAQRAYGQDGVARESEVDWRILPLRSPGGDPRRTDPGGAGFEGFADTPYLDGSPYLAEVLASIPAPLRAVRLMALGPGARVHEHRDGKCGLWWGVVRLHVPVETNPGALIVIGGRRHHWDAGRLWFGDFDRPHYVHNTGGETRTHLVIDCMVTRELLELFPAGFRDRLPWRDVLFARESVPIGAADRRALRCRFPMPAAFPEWSEDPAEERAGDVAGGVECGADGRLVLTVAGRPAFALVHLGGAEFRLEGWTEERTLHLDLSPPAPVVRFRVRAGHTLREWRRPATPAETAETTVRDEEAAR